MLPRPIFKERVIAHLTGIQSTDRLSCQPFRIHPERLSATLKASGRSQQIYKGQSTSDLEVAVVGPDTSELLSVAFAEPKS